MKSILVNFFGNYYNKVGQKVMAEKVTMALLWGTALLPHIFFSFYFFVAEIIPMLVLNLISVLFYLIISYYLVKNRFLILASLVCFEVFAFSIITVIFMGTGTQVHWYLILLPIPVFFYIDFKNVYRVVICVLIVVAIALCLAFSAIFTPPLADCPTVKFLYYFNSILVVVELIFEILAENLVRGFLSIIAKKDMDNLREQSYRDPLTNLFNRRYADIVFSQIAALTDKNGHCEECCVAMLDIDDFKTVNDRFGHDAGDAVLKRIVDAIRSGIRKDDFLFRWGGEEFLIVFRDVSLNQAKIIAGNLVRRARQEIFRYNKVDFSVTITVGLSPVRENRFTEAISRADKNLYNGKRLGKNSVVSEE